MKKVRRSDTIKKPQKLDLSTRQMAIQWEYFGNQFSYLLDKIYSVNSTQYPPFAQLRPVLQNVIVNYLFRGNFFQNAIWSKSSHFRSQCIWPKRTKSSRPICHLAFYISITAWNLLWFQLANFYWNFIDWWNMPNNNRLLCILNYPSPTKFEMSLEITNIKVNLIPGV